MFFFISIGQQAEKIYGPFETQSQLMTLALQSGFDGTNVLLIEGKVTRMTIREDPEVEVAVPFACNLCGGEVTITTIGHDGTSMMRCGNCKK